MRKLFFKKTKKLNFPKFIRYSNPHRDMSSSLAVKGTTRPKEKITDFLGYVFHGEVEEFVQGLRGVMEMCLITHAMLPFFPKVQGGSA